ncbi:MAG: sulfurtransferase [bacterium]|nr:sulfurtransferase [bacterium]
MIFRVSVAVFALGLIFQGAVVGLAESTLPKGKQTGVGLYVTAKEAYEMWRKNPDGVKIVDVRTPEEYVLVGHAPMAYSLPLLVWKPGWYKQKEGSSMMMNADFVSRMKKKFKPADTLLMICRSGGRSARSVNMLAKEGFQKVYTVTDGFEGDKAKTGDKNSIGKRVVNGWKNAGLPWTYEVNPELVYSRDPD